MGRSVGEIMITVDALVVVHSILSALWLTNLYLNVYS